MGNSPPGTAALKDRLAGGERLVGTFVKTAHHQVVEVIARTGLDFIVIDQEHAPFGPADLDRVLMAARLHGLAALVRIPAARPEFILSALDMGAAGLLVPHVQNGEDAAAVVRAAKYSGTRGFSASHRAADYGGADLAEYRRIADKETVIIAQIEDRDALDHLGSIVTTDGVDCVFVGRADLMVSLGADGLDDPRVSEATERIFEAAKGGGKPIGLFLPDAGQVAQFADRGANLFVVGSDQSMLKGAAATLARESGSKG